MKKIAFLLLFSFFSCRAFDAAVQDIELASLPAYHSATVAEIPLGDGAESILSAVTGDFIYFSQRDARWAEKNYGPQNRIAKYGCGPTVLAMLVSSLSEQSIRPDEMAVWCYQNGFFSQNSGSFHSIIPAGARAWGLDAKSLTAPSYSAIAEELYAGRLVVLLMGEGHFSDSGHFLIIRNITPTGELLVADPNSWENSLQAWDAALILREMKHSTDAGGPAWSIGK